MFYDRFKQLCDKRKISVTRAVTEIGLARTIGTKWKNSGATPRGDTLIKIADYFGISPSELLMEEGDAILDMTYDATPLSVKDLQIALLGHTVDDDVWADIMQYAKDADSAKDGARGSKLSSLESIKQKISELNELIEKEA